MAKFGRSFSRRSDFGDDLLNDKLLNLLREDSIDEAIINEELNAANQETLFPTLKTRWQRRLIHFLHSTPVEVLVVVLVVLDVIILLTMLVLELHILELELDDGNDSTEQAITFLHTHCMDSSAVANYSGHSLLTALKIVKELGCHVGHSVTSADGMPLTGSNGSLAGPRHKRAAAVIDGEGGRNSATIHDLEVAEHVLHFCSIFILGLMVAEVLMKVAGLGKSYFRGKMEIVDGLVIFISFAMDLYFYRGIFADGFSNMATVLVIFLLWRIARIFNAILVTAKTRLEFRIRVQKRARSQMVDKVNMLQTEKDVLQKHIDNLRALCRKCNISDDIVRLAEPLVGTARPKSTTKALGSVLKMSMGFASGLGLVPGTGGQGRGPQSGAADERASLLAAPAGRADGDVRTAMPAPLPSNGRTTPPGSVGHIAVSMSSDCAAGPSLLGVEPAAASDSSDAAADDVPLLGREGREEELCAGAVKASSGGAGVDGGSRKLPPPPAAQPPDSAAMHGSGSIGSCADAASQSCDAADSALSATNNLGELPAVVARPAQSGTSAAIPAGMTSLRVPVAAVTTDGAALGRAEAAAHTSVIVTSDSGPVAKLQPEAKLSVVVVAERR